MDKKRFLLDKLVVVGLIISFMCMSVTPTIAIDNVKESYDSINSRDILYVGGSGPNNYTYIQDAMDDASEGDTVFVYEGTYDELIEINTTINLIGENKDFTIINGSEIGTVVTINADYVNITGFTIQNSDFYLYAIEVKSDYSNISDNIFMRNGYGIYIFETSNHIITGNIFNKRHRWRCIRTDYSNNNIISDNKFIRTGYSGIVSSNGDFNIISDNYFYFTNTAIHVFNSEYIIINNNTLIRDTFNDAFVLSKTNYSTITNNSIFSWGFGLQIRNSHYNLISDNYITDCYYDGICFGYYDGDLPCTYNVFKDNIITDNGKGIRINDGSNNNSIYSNNISLNVYGIHIKNPSSSIDNNFYHNNFNNGVNAFDGGSNIWNISYPSGGNYWDEYTGEDNDGDGIGDNPLNISGGGGNKDYYPLIFPWDEQRPVANYTFIEEYGGYIFNGSLSYDRDGKVVSYEWDFGDGTTDEGRVVSHAYNESGTYDITLIVIDNEGYKGNITMTIDAVKNFPPETPTIDGPDSGRWGKPYYFTFQSSDTEGSNLWYFVDWGDEHNTGWMGPFTSGDEISEPHTWGTQDTYIIRCKAKDMYNIHSDWAELEITIPRTRASSFLWYELFSERFPILGRLLFIFRVI